MLTEADFGSRFQTIRYITARRKVWKASRPDYLPSLREHSVRLIEQSHEEITGGGGFHSYCKVDRIMGGRIKPARDPAIRFDPHADMLTGFQQ